MIAPAVRWLLLVGLATGLMATSSFGQATPPARGPATSATAASTQGGAVKPFKPEELEQLTASIALYPDSLVAQVLMAATYPVEIVIADRWREANKALTGAALAAELNKKEWDPSVKSLVDFPQVLHMMAEQLDWTTKLGDAFISDQVAVMNAIQRLRARAKAQGSLKDGPELRVSQQAGTIPAASEGPPAPPQIIVIESKNPDVVYVPTYNPAVVYGGWPYPAYPPPAPYYPPGYVATGLISFGAGVAVGAAWGHAWGGCDWGHGSVDVDVNRNVNRNTSINRDVARQNIQNRAGNSTGAGVGNRAAFQHDPAHRNGVAYRDQATANRLNSPQSRQAAAARESFRGRADAGRLDIARGGTDGFRGTGAAAGNRPPVGGAAGAGGNRPAIGGGGPTASPRPAARPSQGNAFAGASRGGASERAASSRGQVSRARPSPSRSSGGGARPGGAGIRSGGGGGRRR